jgi:hypothetical protein
MIARMITLPELGMISGTRAALGAGVALLLADRLSDEQRRAVGWTLVGVGVISSIPLFAEIMSRRPLNEPASGRNAASAGTPARERAMSGL